MAARKRVSQIVSVQLGIGGLNARDALSAMPPTDALILDNWVVTSGGLKPRNGYAPHATVDSANPVQFLETWSGPTGAPKMIAGIGGGLYDVTNPGTGTLLLAPPYASSRWQCASFGGVLTLVNGIDAPQRYDGSAVTAPTWTGTGLTPSNLVTVCVYRSRLWFAEINSLRVWYGGVGTIQGALTAFDLSSIAAYGGRVQLITTWTHDTGAGSQEFLVFVTSNGEVLVYSGGDPGASDFALANRFKIGNPIGRRCGVRIGGDRCLITEDGWSPLSSLLSIGLQIPSSKISDKIGTLQTDEAKLNSTKFGWEALYYPRGNFLLFNVPQTENISIKQYIFSMDTGAWSTWSGLNACTWCVHNTDLYFGGAAGKVYKADTNVDDNGNTILVDCQSAFSDAGFPGQYKTVKMLRPSLLVDGNISVAAIADSDYQILAPRSLQTSQGTAQILWDPASWAVWTVWNIAQSARVQWLGASTEGFTIGVRFQSRIRNIQLLVLGMDVLFEAGGIL